MAQVCAGSVQHDAAVLKHIASIGQIQANHRVLLSHQHGHALLLGEALQGGRYFLDDEWCQTQRRFIQKQQ